jgi:hypothetical protein
VPGPWFQLSLLRFQRLEYDLALRGINLQKDVKLSTESDVTFVVVFYLIKNKALAVKDTHTMTEFLSRSKGRAWVGEEKMAFEQLQVSPNVCTTRFLGTGHIHTINKPCILGAMCEGNMLYL